MTAGAPRLRGHGRASTSAAPPTVDGEGGDAAVSLKDLARHAKRDAERVAIKEVLDHVHWNRVKAARLLGISRKALLYKIVQCGLAPGASATRPSVPPGEGVAPADSAGGLVRVLPPTLAVPVVRGEVLPRRTATLAEAIPHFLAWFREVRGRGEHTILAYRFDLESFLAHCTSRGLRYPNDLSHQDVELHLATLARVRGLKPQTVNRHLSALKGFWIWMLREGLATTNPPALAFGPKVPARRIPPFIPDPYYDLVLTTLAQDRTLLGRRDYAVVATLLLTGLRVSELVGLRLQDVAVHGEGGTLYVAHGKGGRDRYVTVPPRLCEILRGYLSDVRPALVGRPPGSVRQHRRRWEAKVGPASRKLRRYFASEPEARQWLATVAPVPRDAEWLFINANPRGGHRLRRAGQPLLTRSVYARIKLTVSAIVGCRVWPHLLRHSYAVRLRSRGAPIELIKEELGHARLDSTTIYANIPTAQRHADVAKYLESGGAVSPRALTDTLEIARAHEAAPGLTRRRTRR